MNILAKLTSKPVSFDIVMYCGLLPFHLLPPLFPHSSIIFTLWYRSDKGHSQAEYIQHRHDSQTLHLPGRFWQPPWPDSHGRLASTTRSVHKAISRILAHGVSRKMLDWGRENTTG